MCQEAVDLDRNLAQVRGALGDLEAQLSSRRQVEIAEAQRDIARQSVESQESAHRIHMALTWIEVFIVVAYAAELIKFFVIELPHIKEPWMRWTAGTLSIATGVAALLVLRPWDSRHGKKGGHGGMDVHEGIVRSCNVFFYTVGNRLGIEKIAKWGARFGLGQETGLPLRQSTGILPSAAWKEKARGEPWYAGETISVAIGQGYLQVTPIQMAVVAAAIANGGLRVTPHLGERPGESLPPQPIGLSPRTVEIIRSAMIDVVESERGTARRARVPGIRMAGKTGTAQTISREANRSDVKDNAWFIGFGPADRPTLAWAIIVESGGHGGEAAAPIASFVVERALARSAQAPAPTGAAPGQLAQVTNDHAVSVR
jgi:hypothetical protein